jgi:CysZ protein
VTDLLAGAAYLIRGLGWAGRHPGRWLFGLIPAVIVLMAYVAGLTALAVYDADLARALSPFADHWAEGLRDAVRILIGVLLIGAAVMIAIVTFAGVTLAVGAPFYESIAGRVEQDTGGLPPETQVPLLRQLTRGIGDAVVVGLMTTGFAVVFFVLGFLPAIGQTVMPVVAACVSGYFLTLEMTSIALERRGFGRRERFALLRRNRALVVGFGAAVFVVFLIPLGAVLAMPAAVAGGTLLARERLVAVDVCAPHDAVEGGAVR